MNLIRPLPPKTSLCSVNLFVTQICMNLAFHECIHNDCLQLRDKKFAFCLCLRYYEPKQMESLNQRIVETKESESNLSKVHSASENLSCLLKTDFCLYMTECVWLSCDWVFVCLCVNLFWRCLCDYVCLSVNVCVCDCVHVRVSVFGLFTLRCKINYWMDSRF